MKNEMNLMNMDERQRLAWFMANRGTLIAVGAAWIGMIGWELTHDRVPTFLLIMIPIFAILRAGLYILYGSKPFVETDSSEATSLVQYGKVAATILLFVAAVLPIYGLQGSPGEESQLTYTWNMVGNDSAAVFPLVIIYLWPLFTFSLSRMKKQWLLSALAQYAEPFLAVLSSIIVLWIPQLIFETRILFGLVIVPLNPVPAWGCYLAVAANGLYLVSWFAGLLRPWTVQEQ
jgi:hypothetical protein